MTSRNRAGHLASITGMLLLIAAGGCSSHIKLKPQPVIYGAGPGKLDVAEVTPQSKQTRELPVFYATNRAAKGKADDRHYTNGVGDKLRLGVATVQLGDAKTTWAQIQGASEGKSANPAFRVVRARELGRLHDDAGVDGDAAFVEAIDQQLAAHRNHQVNIYVHGYHTDMNAELEILAKLSHYSGRGGAMICFAWPARQSLLLYGGDVKRGRASAHHLADLIELIGSRTKADRINVLTYSCGATVATDALLQLRERYKDEETPALSKRLRLGNVIFAASDLDLKTFARGQIQEIGELGEGGVVIYANKNDAALGISALGAGNSRLGRPDMSEVGLTRAELERATANPRLQMIDVTDVPGPKAAGGGLGGHGYWYANDRVMTDVLVSLRWQVPADQRGLYRKPGKGAWSFPKDYPEKITAAVRRLASPTLPTTAPTTQPPVAPE